MPFLRMDYVEQVTVQQLRTETNKNNQLLSEPVFITMHELFRKDEKAHRVFSMISFCGY